MNIYAIRDRQIDYFLTPFAAMSDQGVMAAVSTTVNNQASTDAITQAPHHFEIWKLGTVDEQGSIKEEKSLVINCARLIRSRVREDDDRDTQGNTPGVAGDGGTAAPSPAGGQTGPNAGSVQEPP
ncbi:MAG: nonstructural protein [Microvirus sp.]|nr:MAG: nonstructural protein [Microvirus sp.]